MQNIPGIELDNANDHVKVFSPASVNKNENSDLFAALFDQHSTNVQKELALAPVSHEEKMIDSAPVRADEKPEPKRTEEKVVAKTEPEPEPEAETQSRDEDLDQKMTQEDLDAVKEDLEAYGMTEEEIAELEERIDSEEGLTWGQFANAVANKMSDMRKVELSDDQKAQLTNFFAKFGFNQQESAKLIERLENGEHAKVMSELQTKLDAMPKEMNLLITKDEMAAFSAAMSFSKEFTGKVKEFIGKNPVAEDVKQAFAMMNDEMAKMDAKDEKLVKAVGQAFVKSMSEELRASTAAKEVETAVDLKPRVAEDGPRADVKRDLKEAVDVRREGAADNAARKGESKAAVQNNLSETMDQGKDASKDNNNWNNFFGKLRDDGGQQAANQIQNKADKIEGAIRTALHGPETKSDLRSWEKISEPKVMRQVETAFIKTLNSGAKQLTLQLNPENLGKLNIMLQVQGKEVTATIRAENNDAFRIINENIDLIKNALENEGLKVTKLDVQSGMSGSAGDRNWFGQDQHNMASDREAMAHLRNHMKAMRGEGDGVAQDMQSAHHSANRAEQGLHIIA